MSAFVAIDLGAESGRAIVGHLNGDQIHLHEVHRFLHTPIPLPTGLHWDVTGIWNEILTGLEQAANWGREKDVEIVSVGVDTWGVDWALISKSGELMSAPHAYRDERNLSAYEQAVEKLGQDRIYQSTGIQLMHINSLFSLYAMHRADADVVSGAHKMLFMPDLFHFWLSGVESCEHTIASTSQMLDVHSSDWDHSLLQDLGIPTQMTSDISPPGTVIGTLRQEVAKRTGLSPETKVTLPPTHDTASAVAAVPVSSERPWLYLSSGTWSLLGAELDNPCVTPAAQKAMFTNEVGVNGTIRFLKNIAGLWLVQQCRADWASQGQTYSYAELTDSARNSEPFRTIVDPGYGPFQLPGDMLTKINDFARKTNQPLCETTGQFVRCCLESLALAYRNTTELLESVLETKFEVMHIVGGGGQNLLLNELTSNALGIEVVVGPYEATAVGNALVQAMGAGMVSDLAAVRNIVCNSFAPTSYQPNDTDIWNEAYQRFIDLKNAGID